MGTNFEKKKITCPNSVLFISRHIPFCNKVSILRHISINLFAVNTNLWQEKLHCLSRTRFHYALWKRITSFATDCGILALILLINLWLWSWARIIGDQMTFRNPSALYISLWNCWDGRIWHSNSSMPMPLKSVANVLF